MPDGRSGPERLSTLEANQEIILEELKVLRTMRDEFIVLKSRVGLVSATIGVVFAALTTAIISLFMPHPPSP